jgi:hypothetical protein
MDLTALFVANYIQQAGNKISVSELGTKLYDILQNAHTNQPLWFTYGPYSSLEDFIFELRALGTVAFKQDAGELFVGVTPGGSQWLQQRAGELPDLPKILGLAA